MCELNIFTMISNIILSIVENARMIFTKPLSTQCLLTIKSTDTLLQLLTSRLAAWYAEILNFDMESTGWIVKNKNQTNQIKRLSSQWHTIMSAGDVFIGIFIGMNIAQFRKSRSFSHLPKGTTECYRRQTVRLQMRQQRCSRWQCRRQQRNMYWRQTWKEFVPSQKKKKKENDIVLNHLLLVYNIYIHLDIYTYNT